MLRKTLVSCLGLVLLGTAWSRDLQASLNPECPAYYDQSANTYGVWFAIPPYETYFGDQYQYYVFSHMTDLPSFGGMYDYGHGGTVDAADAMWAQCVE